MVCKLLEAHKCCVVLLKQKRYGKLLQAAAGSLLGPAAFLGKRTLCLSCC